MNWLRFYTNKSAIIALFFLLFSATESFSKAIYQATLWPEQAKSYNGRQTGLIYIRAGTFKSKANALSFKNHLQARIRAPIMVQFRNNQYSVLIGPMRTPGEVRQVGLCLTNRNSSCIITNRTVHRAVQKPVVHVNRQKVIQAKKPVPQRVAMAPRKQPVANWHPAKVSKEFPFDWYPTPNEELSAPVKEKNLDIGSENVQVYRTNALSQLSVLNSWFVSADLERQWVQSDQMTVNNGSGFPPPSNIDIYTGGVSSNQSSLGFTAGYRWQNEGLWIPQFSLGLRYKYLFENDLTGKVIQYSLPEFTNYDYTYKASSNALLLAAKVDFYAYKQIMPYLSVGIGSALNQTSYSESALPGITPRISPSFADQSTVQLTYTLGAGLDAQLTERITLSAGYEYQGWGAFNSGKGTVGWSDQSLSQSNYQSHALLLSMDYLFNY